MSVRDTKSNTPQISACVTDPKWSAYTNNKEMETDRDLSQTVHDLPDPKSTPTKYKYLDLPPSPSEFPERDAVSTIFSIFYTRSKSGF
jgi:hypothetical protein